MALGMTKILLYVKFQQDLMLSCFVLDSRATSKLKLGRILQIQRTSCGNILGQDL